VGDRDPAPPGIYARDRLPLAHITRGTPALHREDDVYTNHIHADDLAAIARGVAALRAGASGTYQRERRQCDQAWAIGLDLVADHAASRRPRASRRAKPRAWFPRTSCRS